MESYLEEALGLPPSLERQLPYRDPNVPIRGPGSSVSRFPLTSYESESLEKEYEEQKDILADYLRGYLNQLNENPDTDHIMDQLFPSDAEKSDIISQIRRNQMGSHIAMGPIYDHHSTGILLPEPGERTALQKLVEKYPFPTFPALLVTLQ